MIFDIWVLFQVKGGLHIERKCDMMGRMKRHFILLSMHFIEEKRLPSTSRNRQFICRQKPDML